jgi:hypothetical protein
LGTEIGDILLVFALCPKLKISEICVTRKEEGLVDFRGNTQNTDG